MRMFIIGFLVMCTLIAGVPAVAAQGVAPFADVPASHPAYQAIQYLHEQGILQGYADNTFKPNAQVDRAAAVKMVLAGRITDEEVESLQNPGFTDIPADAWYDGYVAKAVALHVIDGPDKSSTFKGSTPVVLGAFLKIAELAQGMDPNSFSEIQLPLASDVSDVHAWFYPYVRLGIASSLLQVDKNGLLHPDATLTRADVATYVYRLLMYKENRRTQALLSLTETELAGNVIANLNPEGLASAKMAQARALVAARGALASKPDNTLVKGAVKVTEGFGALVNAYEAGVAGNIDQVLVLAGKAYELAAQAKTFSASLTEIADNMQGIAHNMAEEARALKG